MAAALETAALEKSAAVAAAALEAVEATMAAAASEKAAAVKAAVEESSEAKSMEKEITLLASAAAEKAAAVEAAAEQAALGQAVALEAAAQQAAAEQAAALEAAKTAAAKQAAEEQAAAVAAAVGLCSTEWAAKLKLAAAYAEAEKEAAVREAVSAALASAAVDKDAHDETLAQPSAVTSSTVPSAVVVAAAATEVAVADAAGEKAAPKAAAEAGAALGMFGQEESRSLWQTKAAAMMAAARATADAEGLDASGLPPAGPLPAESADAYWLAEQTTDLAPSSLASHGDEPQAETTPVDTAPVGSQDNIELGREAGAEADVEAGTRADSEAGTEAGTEAGSELVALVDSAAASVAVVEGEPGPSEPPSPLQPSPASTISDVPTVHHPSPDERESAIDGSGASSARTGGTPSLSEVCAQIQQELAMQCAATSPEQQGCPRAERTADVTRSPAEGFRLPSWPAELAHASLEQPPSPADFLDPPSTGVAPSPGPVPSMAGRVSTHSTVLASTGAHSESADSSLASIVVAEPPRSSSGRAPPSSEARSGEARSGALGSLLSASVATAAPAPRAALQTLNPRLQQQRGGVAKQAARERVATSFKPRGVTKGRALPAVMPVGADGRTADGGGSHARPKTLAFGSTRSRGRFG